MSETPIRKKVDESWKDQVAHERQQPEPPAAGQPAPGPAPVAAAGAPEKALGGDPGLPQPSFELFVSGLAMDALISLGEVPNPVTRKQSVALPQARYLIDLLAILEQKTRGNLSADEERLLKDALYQLRMRYLAKSGGA